MSNVETKGKAWKYLEKNGLRVVPVYEGLSPIGFLVVNTSNNETVVERKRLYEAEDFILRSKELQRGPTVGSAAELKSY